MADVLGVSEHIAGRHYLRQVSAGSPGALASIMSLVQAGEAAVPTPPRPEKPTVIH